MSKDAPKNLSSDPFHSEASKAACKQGSKALIDINDFKSIQLRVLITNTTTKTEPDDNARFELIQLLDRGVVLGVPARICAKGHHLLFRVIASNIAADSAEPLRFASTAVVEECEQLDEHTDRIVVELLQYEEKSWLELGKIFDQRQKEIFEFLKAARG